MQQFVIGLVRVPGLGKGRFFFRKVVDRIVCQPTQYLTNCLLGALLLHGIMQFIDHPEQDLVLIIEFRNTGREAVIPLKCAGQFETSHQMVQFINLLSQLACGIGGAAGTVNIATDHLGDHLDIAGNLAGGGGLLLCSSCNLADLH